jgi:hypothetical protein
MCMYVMLLVSHSGPLYLSYIIILLYFDTCGFQNIVLTWNNKYDSELFLE